MGSNPNKFTRNIWASCLYEMKSTSSYIDNTESQCRGTQQLELYFKASSTKTPKGSELSIVYLQQNRLFQ